MAIKGQSFSVGAIVFSSLLLLIVFSFQGPEYSQDNSVKNYYQNILTNQQEVYNNQIKENYSTEKIKHSVYLYNRFVNTTSARKGLDYSGFQALILPERGQALFINYRPNSIDFTFEGDEKHTKTLASLENTKISISSSYREYNLTVSELNINESFGADGPTLVTYTRLNNSNQNWEDYVVR
ncbi:MAG: hypothetical protein ABEJ56_05155 [Candidatus Nanohaloarchaea archaeon]